MTRHDSVFVVPPLSAAPRASPSVPALPLGIPTDVGFGRARDPSARGPVNVFLHAEVPTRA